VDLESATDVNGVRHFAWLVSDHGHGATFIDSPYGGPGDVLWVRETFAEWSERYTDASRVSYRADGDPSDSDLRWTPSIHMPRRLCRLLLRVTAVRAERIQSITDADARAEGVEDRGEFERLWRGQYGDAAWAANPWVWVVSFTKETDE
jgi:hypothetical protein